MTCCPLLEVQLLLLAQLAMDGQLPAPAPSAGLVLMLAPPSAFLLLNLYSKDNTFINPGFLWLQMPGGQDPHP